MVYNCSSEIKMGVGNLAGCLSISFFLHSPSSTLILARILKTLHIKTQAQHNIHTLRHIHTHTHTFFFPHKFHVVFGFIPVSPLC